MCPDNKIPRGIITEGVGAIKDGKLILS